MGKKGKEGKGASDAGRLRITQEGREGCKTLQREGKAQLQPLTSKHPLIRPWRPLDPSWDDVT